jgi:hypothetical protein
MPFLTIQESLGTGTADTYVRERHASKDTFTKLDNDNFLPSTCICDTLRFIQSTALGQYKPEPYLCNKERLTCFSVFNGNESKFNPENNKFNNALKTQLNKEDAEVILPINLNNGHYVTGIIKKTNGLYELIIDNSLPSESTAGINALKTIMRQNNIPETDITNAKTSTNSADVNGTNQCAHRTLENIISLMDDKITLQERIATKWSSSERFQNTDQLLAISNNTKKFMKISTAVMNNEDYKKSFTQNIKKDTQEVYDFYHTLFTQPSISITQQKK